MNTNKGKILTLTQEQEQILNHVKGDSGIGITLVNSVAGS